MAFDLTDIRATIRNITSTPSEYQLTNAALDDLINKFILYVLPDDMKPFKLLVPYIFETLMNQVEYDFDLNTYVSLEPEFFINGMQLLYYQDQSLWLRDFQYQYNQSSIGIGNGVQTTFQVIPTQNPIIPTTVIVTDGIENFTDPLGNGVLTGTLGGIGSVDYTTGAISVTFFTAPPLSSNVYLTYAPLNNGKPRAMYYSGNGKIQFSPIPDQAYRIEGQAYIQPTALLAGGAGTQTLLVDVWGYTVCYGVSLEIFRQRGQLDQLNQYRPEYEYYLDRAQSRSTQQYSNQRSVAKW
ncbi:MAG TPA: hypothetical protein VKZ95_08795 [Sphingobacteriaceae bacterium]|nr:hypothetical protein [Sphingobacteriaceae bacterium]